MRYNWKALNRQQVGAFSECFVKMELTILGFQVYSTEIDDGGIDFVARYENGPFLSIQVKSIREKGYIFMQKEKFDLSANLYLALAILDEGAEPRLFLIPSEAWTAWKEPNVLLVENDYIGKKSKPEWGVNLSKKNMVLLEEYAFPKMASHLKSSKA